jgi:hypothetical protein
MSTGRGRRPRRLSGRRRITRRELLAGNRHPQLTEVTQAQLPRLDIPYMDGVLVARPSGPGECGGVQRPNVTRVEFIPADVDRLTAVAVRMVGWDYVATVVVHHRFLPSRRTALALVVSTRLHRERAAAGLGTDIVTSAVRPAADEGDGLIVIRHGVVVPDDPAGIPDQTVWELMRPDQYTAWRERER